MYENLFFNPSGRLFEEPSSILKQELRSPQTYNGIIAAIASGASRLNEIASKTGIETSQCSNMLTTLINLEIVKKEYPLPLPSVKSSTKTEVIPGNPSRKSIYRLSDFMFRFWYRFVLPDLSRISMGLGKTVCSEIFGKPQMQNTPALSGRLETYTGQVFEECSAQFLWREISRNLQPVRKTASAQKTQVPFMKHYSFKNLGRWWGTNPKEKKEEEIDLLAITGPSPTSEITALFGECKWRTPVTSSDILDDLIRKSELFPNFTKKQYILFSKSNYSLELKKTVAQRKDTVLIMPADMF